MAQITTGIRSLLSHPLVYRTSQLILGAEHARKEYVNHYIKPFEHAKILDIGCGTADILEYFPATVDYFGFDLNDQYIQYAKNKYRQRGTFVCNDVNNQLHDLPKFDIILANGLLHHLGDQEVENLFSMAVGGLEDKGRMLTFDCCYIENQSKLAKYIISKDRGQNIRRPSEYQKFALKTFQHVNVDVRHDLLKIPYTHIIMECSK